MKKILLIFLMSIPFTVFGQNNKTYKEEFQYRRNDFFGLYNNWKGTQEFYYNENDEKILHGKIIIDDKFSGNKNGQSLNEIFKSNFSYKDGSIDGPFKISFKVDANIMGQQMNTYWEARGTYANGWADGTMTASLALSALGHSGAENYTARFSDRKMTELVMTETFDGKKKTVANYKINNDLLTGTIYDKITIKNNIITSYFIRLTQQESAPEEHEQAILAAITDSIAAGIDPSEWLLNQGYVLKEVSVYDPINRFMSFMYDTVQMSYWEDDENKQIPLHDCTFKALKKVRLADLDKLKKWVETYSNQRHIIYFNRDSVNYKKNIFAKEEFLSIENGEIYIDNEPYRFKSSTKQAFLEYLEPFVKSETEALEQMYRLKTEMARSQAKTKLMGEMSAAMKCKLFNQASKGDVVALRIIDYTFNKSNEITKIEGEYDIKNNAPWGFRTFHFVKEFSNGYTRVYNKDVYENMTSTKIENIWDTILSEVSQILAMDSTIKASFADKTFKSDLKGYKAYSDTMNVISYVKADDGKVSYQRIARIKSIYSKYTLYSQQKKAFLATNEELENLDDKEAKDILKAYRSYAKEHQVNLETHPAVDQALAQIETNLKTQQDIKTFISLRHTIVDNDQRIEDNKEGKNIIKIYKSYYKNYNNEWSGPDAIELAKTVIEKQQKVIEILARDDIKAFNKDVKDIKCKDIDSLIQMAK